MNPYPTNMYPYSYTATPYQPNPYAQPQAPRVSFGLHGAMVQSVDNITADSVPMDGSIAVFPKQDLSEIYVKNWNADGTIRTLTFRPVVDSVPASNPENVLTALQKQVENLSNKVRKLESSMKTRHYGKENKQNVDTADAT